MRKLEPMHVLIVIVAALIIGFAAMVGYYTDYLWFSSAGYSSVFLTILKWKLLTILIGFILAFVFLYINVKIAKKISENILSDRGIQYEEIGKSVLLIGTAIVSFLFSLSFSGNWKTILLYLNRVSFGVEDPILSKDAGFYIFELPFLSFIRNTLLGLTFLALIAAGVIYFYRAGPIISPGSRRKGKEEFDFDEDFEPDRDFGGDFGLGTDILNQIPTRIMIHVSALLSLIFGLIAFSFLLNRYGLLFSTRGVVTGAGYTDVNIKLPILYILAILAALTAVAVLANIALKDVRVPLAGVVLIVVLFLAGTIVPGIYQQFRVEPNELEMESPYLEYNIKYTREGFGLTDVQEHPFEATMNITRADVDNNMDVIKNIRVWDRRALEQTYKQLQQIRTYYTFKDVDTDRYTAEGGYQQYMISLRELDMGGISPEARTWVNERLVYTHGFGMVMNPVSEKTEDGQPNLVVKDIPPQGEFTIENPRIYYGELTNDYKIVNSDKEEFDYPKGAENVFMSYDGTGGVQLDSFIKNFMYFLKYREPKFLLSDYITEDSRLMYNRNILERARKVAPFLSYDSNSYPVLSEGQIYWIIDAYTTASTFPYSEKYQAGLHGINYIRNSVKVVIDAHDGTVDFYMMEEEPIVKAYSKIFPDLFKSYEEMPEGLKSHIRYPKDFFKVQMEMYRIYHMTDPQTFYNREDAWQIPTEMYRGSSITMEPYYLLTKLLNGEGLEYILMQPFTPRGRENMIAWIAARCDVPHYGELRHYELSKGRLIYGPKQIESRVDQDPTISEQLTLWGQTGSRVIRGNLLVVPIGNSILYAEPIFISAEESEIPELRRVVTSDGEKVIMDETLVQSLNKLVKGAELPEEEEDGVPQTVKELAQEALDHYNKAQEYLQKGDWKGYGDEMEKVQELLDQLNQVLEEEE